MHAQSQECKYAEMWAFLKEEKKRKEKDEISSIAANNKGTDRYTQMNVVMNYVTVM
jgi:hypothetical protein